MSENKKIIKELKKMSIFLRKFYLLAYYSIVVFCGCAFVFFSTYLIKFVTNALELETLTNQKLFACIIVLIMFVTLLYIYLVLLFKFIRGLVCVWGSIE